LRHRGGAPRRKAAQIGDPIECSMRLRRLDLRKASGFPANVITPVLLRAGWKAQPSSLLGGGSSGRTPHGKAEPSRTTGGRAAGRRRLDRGQFGQACAMAYPSDSTRKQKSTACCNPPGRQAIDPGRAAIIQRLEKSAPNSVVSIDIKSLSTPRSPLVLKLLVAATHLTQGRWYNAISRGGTHDIGLSSSFIPGTGICS
jgi:hypothetical protein